MNYFFVRLNYSLYLISSDQANTSRSYIDYRARGLKSGCSKSFGAFRLKTYSDGNEDLLYLYFYLVIIFATFV